MARILTVAQQKGGVGKTMLVANLAAYAARSARVAVIDLDPQASLAQWHALRPPTRPAIALAAIPGWRLFGALDRLGPGFDLILIDTAPNAETDSRQAIGRADQVLLPIQPSLPDLWALDASLAFARAAKKPVSILLNRVPAASRLLNRVEAECRAKELPVLTARLGNRTGFATAFALGLGVTEASPRATAARELEALAHELGLVGTRPGAGSA